MIAYNTEWLDNNYILQELEAALDEDCIDLDEMDNIHVKYPSGFYTPNFFVALGLFLLTVVIISFSFSFVLVLTMTSLFAVASVFFGLVSYVALEMIVRKGHYRSGVDSALLWMTGVLIVGGLNAQMNIPDTWNAALVFALATYFSIRFADAVMGILAFIMLLWLAFLVYSKLGEVAKASAPFLLAAISATAYFGVRTMIRHSAFRHYRQCLVFVEIAALIGLYACCNYFVVREMSNELFHLQLREGQGIPLAWLFWLLTMLIPLLYLLQGIQKKDAVLIRVALLVIVCSVVTIRHYYHVIAIEKALVMGGILLIGLAYGLIHYFKTSRRGFTANELPKPGSNGKWAAESLLIAEVAGTDHPSVATATHFGGGTGTGGGAGGTF